MTKLDVLSEFSEVLRKAGLTPDEIIADGHMHRCPTEGQRNKKAGSYIIYLDEPVCGGYQNWREGDWCDWRPDGKISVDPIARERMDAIKAARAREAEHIREVAEQEVRDTIEAAAGANPRNLYIVKKNIGTEGLLEDSKSLLLPIYKLSTKGEALISHERIFADGGKRFKKGISLKGAMARLGKLDGNGIIYIAEGWATAATIYNAIDRSRPVVIALYADNIAPVIESLQSTFGGIRIIVCADNDAAGAKNKGLETAKTVAERYGVEYCIPPISGDFNDLFIADSNYERVKAALLDTIKSKATSTHIPNKARKTNWKRIKPMELKWLWPEKLLYGAVNLLAGQPGTGKSTITMDIAARVTNGLEWPDGARACQPANVVVLSSEDQDETTTVPRFLGHGGDPARVWGIKSIMLEDGERTVDLRRDVDKLISVCDEVSPKLLIIDPVSSYMLGTDTHKNSDVRGALEPLSRMAQDLDICILIVTHFNKGSSDDKRAALDRITGSGAFGALARRVWITTEDESTEEDEDPTYLFLHAKGNTTRAKPRGLSYSIESKVVSEVVEYGHINWLDEVRDTAQSYLGGRRTRETKDGMAEKTKEAEIWLERRLVEGAVYVDTIMSEGKASGFPSWLLYRLKKTVGVKSKRSPKFESRDLKWMWYIDTK